MYSAFFFLNQLDTIIYTKKLWASVHVMQIQKKLAEPKPEITNSENLCRKWRFIPSSKKQKLYFQNRSVGQGTLHLMCPF